MRGISRLGVLVLTGALALTGCGFGARGGDGQGGGSTGGATNLTLLVPSYSDGTKQRWEGVIDGFQKANPGVTVSLEVQSWDDINDVVRTKVQSNQAPDILNIDAWAGFARDNLLYRADEVTSPATLADFQPAFRDNASAGGTPMALPLIASTRALFYNTDLFARAGIAAPPRTWDELLADAQRVSALGGDVHGYGMPLGREEAQAETSIWTFGAGGSWGDGTTLTVDTPANLAGLTAMRRMVDAKVTQPDPGATDRTPLINVFIQGELGMIEALPPTVGQIAQKNPGLHYAVAPIPTQSGAPVTLGVADHLMAFRNGGTKAGAIRKFLDYYFSAPVYGPWVKAEGFLPTTRSGEQALQGSLAGDQRLATFLRTLPDARFYPSTNQRWSATQGALQSLVGQIGQGADPAAVLSQIAQQSATG